MCTETRGRLWHACPLPWYIMIQYRPPSQFACSILRTLGVSTTFDFLWQTKKNLFFANPCHHPSSHHSAYGTANGFFKPRSIPTTPTPSSKLLKPNSSKDISFLCHMIWAWLPRLFWRVRVYVSKICEDGLPNSSHPWPTFHNWMGSKFWKPESHGLITPELVQRMHIRAGTMALICLLHNLHTTNQRVVSLLKW